MSDPIEIGLTMHRDLMLAVKALHPTEEQFVRIARLADIVIGSVEVRAAREGLSRPEAEHVEAIRQKLESLGLMQ